MAAITGPQLSVTHIDNRVTIFMRIVLFFLSRLAERWPTYGNRGKRCVN